MIEHTETISNENVKESENVNVSEYILRMKKIPNQVLCWRTYFQKMFDITASYKSLESFQSKLDNNNKIYFKIPITQNLYAKQYKKNKNEIYFYISKLV